MDSNIISINGEKPKKKLPCGCVMPDDGQSEIYQLAQPQRFLRGMTLIIQTHVECGRPVYAELVPTMAAQDRPNIVIPGRDF